VCSLKRHRFQMQIFRDVAQLLAGAALKLPHTQAASNVCGMLR
jgi:hypothetical protein